MRTDSCIVDMENIGVGSRMSTGGDGVGVGGDDVGSSSVAFVEMCKAQLWWRNVWRGCSGSMA